MTRPPIHNKSDLQAINEGCYFDAAFARKKVRWIEQTYAFHPYKWQRQLLLSYFGWRRADGGYRFTRLVIFVPKKNGKTTLIAALVGEKCFELRNARIYSSAFNAMQAKILMEELIRLSKNSPKLRPLMKPRVGKIKAFCTPFRRDLTNDITGTKYVALADNVNANDGLIPDFLVVDEIHRMKNSQVDVVLGGVTNNPNATTVIISTAGSGEQSERGWQEYQYAKQIITGERIDTRILPIIHEHPDPAALKGIDIYTMEALLAANPVLREVPEKRAEAERELEKARAVRNDRWWRRYRLGQWCTDDGDPYINAAAYEKCETAEVIDTEGKDCFVGLDKTGGAWDFTALTALFPLDDGRVYEKHFTFAAADRISEMSERDDIDYTPFIDSGELITIPADAVADEWLYEWCKEQFQSWRVKQIAADPYAASYLLERWKADGFEVVAVQQSNNRLLSPVIDDLARRIFQVRIIHRPNALVAWQLSCARAFTTAKDLKKIVKAGSSVTGKGGSGHIDNIDSLLNALAALRAEEITKAAYAGTGGAVLG